MRPESITISARHMRQLAEHASGASPQESCALLFGRGSTVFQVHMTDNADPRPDRRFAIPPDQLIEAYEIAGRRGLEVVGIFHSHPSSGAFPSDTDVQFMRINPVVWVILSGMDGQARAYTLDEDGASPAVIRINEASEDY